MNQWEKKADGKKFIFFAESRFFPPCGSLLKEKEVKSDVKVV